MSRKRRTKRRDAPADERLKPHRHWVLAACGVLVASTLVVYANSFSGVFVFDDIDWIVKNDTLRSWGDTFTATSSGNDWGLRRRPIAGYSFALNYALGDLNPWGYHAVNLLIHVCAGLLLFDLLRRTFLLKAMPDRLRNGSTLLAFAVALLWLVHPLQTASVTYIVQRFESAMGMFFLACLYCVLRGSQSRRPWLWYVGAIATCWLGMGSKEVMIVVPIVALLYDRVFLAPSWREVFVQRWWVYLGFLPAVIYLVYVVQSPPECLARPIRAWPGHDKTSWEYFRSQPGVILHYLRLVFSPSGLCLDYGWPVADSAIAIVVPGLLVTLMFLASLLAFRYAPGIGFLGLSFFLILAPSSSFMPLNDLAFEHRMYLPLACVLTLMVIGTDWLLSTAGGGVRSNASARPLWAIVAVGVAAVALGTCTVVRNRAYASREMIYQDAVDVSPNCARAHYNLATRLMARNDYTEGIEHCRRAIELEPEYSLAFNLLGVALRKLGRDEEAIKMHFEALRLEPRLVDAHVSLGLAFQAQGKLDEAVASYRRALELDPNLAKAHINLGNVLADQQKLDEAIASYRRALELQPNLAETHNNLANALMKQGKLDKAVASYRRALQLNPNIASAHYNLGMMSIRTAPGRAQEHFRRTLEINPNIAEAHCYLATLLANQGRYAKAIEHYKRALAINPDMPTPRRHLAILQQGPSGNSPAKDPNRSTPK